MVETPFKLRTGQAVRITLEWTVLGLLVNAAIYAVLRLWPHGENASSNTEQLWGFIAANVLTCIWVIRRTVRRHHLTWSSLGPWGIKPAGLAAPFLLLVLGTGIVLSDVSNLIEYFLPVPATLRELFQEMSDLSMHPYGSFLAIVVMAALTEETVFRGLVLRGLLGEKRPWRAVVISSALFAVMHLNPWQLATAFVAGLILGWAYLRTQSLGLCIAGHALNNAVSLFAPVLPFKIVGFNTAPSPGAAHFQPWWLLASGVVLLVFSAAWFHRAAPPLRALPVLPEADAATVAETTAPVGPASP
jgi:membrane protease YdiL (CAAX protease family)